MCLTFSIIPRTAGVSRSTEERPRRASPSPLSVARCRSVQPMKLPSIVTVIIFSAVVTVLLPQVPHGLAAHRGDLVGQIHLSEGVQTDLGAVLREAHPSHLFRAVAVSQVVDPLVG